MALATSQQLADAAASAKVAIALSTVGFFLGLWLTAAGCYMALPEAARKAIPAQAVLKHQLARLPYVLPEIAAQRPVIAQQSPTLHKAFDDMPGYALFGGLAGALLLPLLVMYLKGIQIERRADVGRLNRLVPHK